MAGRAAGGGLRYIEQGTYHSLDRIKPRVSGLGRYQLVGSSSDDFLRSKVFDGTVDTSLESFRDGFHPN